MGSPSYGLFFLQVGIQQKPADLKMKTSNLVHVYVLKDQVRWAFAFFMSCKKLESNNYC